MPLFAIALPMPCSRHLTLQKCIYDKGYVWLLNVTTKHQMRKKSCISFSAANLRAFFCIKSPLMGTLFPHMRFTHRANGLSITSGDFLKDFAVEFRFLEQSSRSFSLSLAIVQTVVWGMLKCFAASTCFFPGD